MSVTSKVSLVRMLIGWGVALVVYPVAGWMTACSPTSVSGWTAGTFDVTATLGENECSGGFDPDGTVTYSVEIRASGTEAYWARPGVASVTGTYRISDRHFHFTSQSRVVAWAADASAGVTGCTLVETETIDGYLVDDESDAGLDAAAEVDASWVDAALTDASAWIDVGPHDVGVDAGLYSTGFAASDTIQVSIASGSDCRAILQSAGGTFPALPCNATYAVAATRR